MNSHIKNAFPLSLLGLVFYDRFPKRRLPIERVKLADRLIKKLVINSIQIEDYLIAGIAQRDQVTFLPFGWVAI